MDSGKKITITVKTPKEKQQIEISEDADIKDVSFSRIFDVTHIVVVRQLCIVIEFIFATINKKKFPHQEKRLEQFFLRRYADRHSGMAH